MISAIGSASSGMRLAQVWLDSTADDVANVQTPGYAATEPVAVARPGGVQAVGIASGGEVSLAVELPAALMAKGLLQANAAVQRTAFEAYDAVLELGRR